MRKRAPLSLHFANAPHRTFGNLATNHTLEIGSRVSYRWFREMRDETHETQGPMQYGCICMCCINARRGGRMKRYMRCETTAEVRISWRVRVHMMGQVGDDWTAAQCLPQLLRLPWGVES